MKSEESKRLEKAFFLTLDDSWEKIKVRFDGKEKRYRLDRLKQHKPLRKNDNVKRIMILPPFIPVDSVNECFKELEGIAKEIEKYHKSRQYRIPELIKTEKVVVHRRKSYYGKKKITLLEAYRECIYANSKKKLSSLEEILTYLQEYAKEGYEMDYYCENLIQDPEQKVIKRKIGVDIDVFTENLSNKSINNGLIFIPTLTEFQFIERKGGGGSKRSLKAVAMPFIQKKRRLHYVYVNKNEA